MNTIIENRNEIYLAIEKQRSLNRQCINCTWCYCIGETCDKIDSTFRNLFIRRNKIDSVLRKIEK